MGHPVDRAVFQARVADVPLFAEASEAMNAINPLPSQTSGAEPSMEEILASIRRIIADDQPTVPAPSFESVAADLPMASEAAPVVSEPDAAVAEPLPGLPPEHGIVSAPQFVSPEGTEAFMDSPHPLAPPQEPSGSEVHVAETAVPVPAAANEVVASETDPHEQALRDMHDEVDLRAAVNAAREDLIYQAAASEEPPMNYSDVGLSDALLPQETSPQETSPQETSPPEAPPHQAPAGLAHPGSAPNVAPEESPAAGLFSAATSHSLAAAFNTLAVSRLADDSQELRGLARDMLRPLLKDWLDAHLPGLVESIIREEIDRMARRAR